MYSSESEEVPQEEDISPTSRIRRDKQDKKKALGELKDQQFDKNVREMTSFSNFNIEALISFPHRYREGEVPYRLGKLKHAQGFIDA